MFVASKDYYQGLVSFITLDLHHNRVKKTLYLRLLRTLTWGFIFYAASLQVDKENNWTTEWYHKVAYSRVTKLKRADRFHINLSQTCSHLNARWPMVIWTLQSIYFPDRKLALIKVWDGRWPWVNKLSRPIIVGMPKAVHTFNSLC